MVHQGYQVPTRPGLRYPTAICVRFRNVILGQAEIQLLCCREVPDQPKALFRQAAVHAVLGDFDEAEEGYR